MGDGALHGSFLRCGALSSEVARATTVEAGVAGGGSSGRGGGVQAGASQAEVEVEP
jgi:hypothetical protein